MNRELIKRLSGHLADIIHCHRSSIRIENGITGISPLREISLKLLIGRGMPRQLFRRVHGLVCSTRRIILKTVRPPANSMPVTTIRAITSAASIMTRTITSMTSTVTRMTGIALGIMACAILGTASIVRRMSIAVVSVTGTVRTTSVALGTTRVAIRTASVILRTTTGVALGTTGTASRTTRVALGTARIAVRTTGVALGIMACAILGTTSVALSTARVALGTARIVRRMSIAVRLPGTIGTTGTAISMGRTILGMTSLISPSGTVLPTRTVSGMTSTVRRMSIAVRLPGTVTSSTVVCATGATINVTGVISSRRTRIRRGLRRRYLCRRRRPSSTFASVHMRFRNTRIRDVTRSVRGMRRRRNLDLDIDVRSRPLGDEVRRVNVEIGYLQGLRRDLAGWDAYNRSNGIRIGQNLIRDLQTSADLRGGRPRLAELPNL